MLNKIMMLVLMIFQSFLLRLNNIGNKTDLTVFRASHPRSQSRLPHTGPLHISLDWGEWWREGVRDVSQIRLSFCVQKRYNLNFQGFYPLSSLSSVHTGTLQVFSPGLESTWAPSRRESFSAKQLQESIRSWVHLGKTSSGIHQVLSPSRQNNFSSSFIPPLISFYLFFHITTVLF